jgi:hypothetical protein
LTVTDEDVIGVRHDEEMKGLLIFFREDMPRHTAVGTERFEYDHIALSLQVGHYSISRVHCQGCLAYAD